MNDIGIPFIHRMSARARRVRISLSASGDVVVTTPPRFPTHRIPPIVEEARAWIMAHQQRVKDKPTLLDAQGVIIFGKRYTFVESSTREGSIRIQASQLIVSAPTDEWMPFFLKWLKHRAIEYIAPRVQTLSQTMGVTYSGLSFRAQKTRWGSCSSDKHLSFNWKLIHAPRPVIDYVIIHELAHLTHMHHQKSFWDLVGKYDANYPHHRRWLSTYGSTED